MATLKCLVVMACVVGLVTPQSIGPQPPDEFVDAMVKYLDRSVDYLLASKQFDSQYMERPGMAKMLSAESDEAWEEGLDMLNKHLQRGGAADTIKSKLNVQTQVFPMGDTALLRTTEYGKQLTKLQNDHANMYVTLSQAHAASDVELKHYLDAKLEDEAEDVYKYSKYLTMFAGLKASGVGLKMFDNHL